VNATIVAIITALVGLAVVAVIVGKNAQTSNVVTSAGQALSGVIGAAVAPVS
jgi:PRD1 phage membrane DNA delivery